MPNYYWWMNYSEELSQFPPMVVECSYYGSGYFNRMVQLMGETMPKGNKMVTNLYHAKKLVKKLALGCLIDCFPKGCMLYYNENSYKSITTWKYFDRVHPRFSQDTLGILDYGYVQMTLILFGQYEKSYSCWSVILTSYNLPLGMCMKREFMFLIVLIPEELCTLWNDGILTYDVSSRQNFVVKAILMWIINDFLIYEMLSGWMSTRRLSCPICMERTKVFTLKHYHKVSYFDSQCQFLPLNHLHRRNENPFKKRFVETSPTPPRVSSPNMWNIVAHLALSYELQEEEEIPSYGVEHN
ncbi:hypothetical protein CR513_33147, partial [Mucuna pruriens]